MTALQEIASLKASLEKAFAEAGERSQAVTEGNKALADLQGQMVALAAEKAALMQERNELATKLAEAQTAARDFQAEVETRAAALAVQQVASVGLAKPLQVATATESNQADILAAYAKADAAGKRAIFLKHRKHFSV